MKKETLEHNISFVIEALYFVSRVLELFPFHIDPDTNWYHGSVRIYTHVILATVMNILLHYGLYNSTLL
jgi:hypothetical protein